MSTYLEHPVFLCGHRKTGTTALLCLFDHHPELLTYPADSGFFYRVFPPCESLGKDESIERLVRYTIQESLGPDGDAVGRLVAAGDKTPEEGAALFDRPAIAAAYRAHMAAAEHTPANHLRSLMQAYGEHCGQDSSRWKGWMEKTTSTEVYAVEVAEWFPEAKFIHLLRDPRDNFGSLKSGWSDRYQNWESTQRSLLQSLIDRAGLGMRLAEVNQQALGPDRYRVLRFEDLAADPARHMADLAVFLGIANDPCLETPTVNGIPWPGNNFDGLRFKGLSAANVGKWPSRTEPWEVGVIEGHMGGVMSRFGYDLATTPAERAAACAAHYKWFNFLDQDSRGTA